MKLLQNHVVEQADSQYLAFEVTSAERQWLTPSRIINLLKVVAPAYNVSYMIPPILGNPPDDNGNCKIKVIVGNLIGDKLVKGILVHYAKAGLIKEDDANHISKSVSSIFKTEFSPLDFKGPEVRQNKELDNELTSRREAVVALVNSRSTKVPAETHSSSKKEDDFGSGLVGLHGVFAPKP